MARRDVDIGAGRRGGVARTAARRIDWTVRATRTAVAPLMPALRIIGFVGAVVIVGYIGVRAARKVHPGDLAWWPLPPALAGAAMWWLLLARGWSLLVAGRTTRSDVGLWVRTQALRFLPGGIWAPASRVALVRGDAFHKLSTVAAENLLALCAAAALGGVALAASGRVLWGALAAAIFVPPLAARFVAGRTSLTPARITATSGNYVLAFVGYALAGVLVQVAVSGSVDVLAVAGAALVAWAAGLVVVVVPSGVGVRELVYVDLLSGTLPYAERAAGAVTMRLGMILAELAVLVIAGRPTDAAETEDTELASGSGPGRHPTPEASR